MFVLPYIMIILCYRQVSLDGVTGPVQFNEDGKRRETQLEILNLRNNSFKKVCKQVTSRLKKYE